MIRTVQKELSATSNVNAPKFSFRKYVRGQVYKNNSTDIDFVTDNGNLYVPVSDNADAQKEEGHAKEDNNFMLLVAKGEQGEQGVKGEKGADGRTPAVYARFDGKQMVFYTDVLDEDGNIVYNDNGTRATRRIAATNDLTGPSWKPELVNDTIVWHKTKEDEAPKSIPLSSLIKQTAPVLLRVDSDNTRRMDEMDESGPANYIQWKYEGDEHWNNLISISELMNLTLAGVSIWYNEEDGHYHFGHREVEKASYAASHTGKQIITAVELGEILYDAGPIPLEDWSAQIAALHDYICQVEEKIPTDYVKSVENILPDENGNVDLPNYVKTVNNQVPDNNGNVQIELPNLDGYLKATDLRFKVQNDSDGRFLYFSTRRGEEGTWQKVLEATCSCSVGTRWTVTFGTPNPANAEMVCNDRIVRHGDTMQVRDGDVICITATAENYQRFYECYTITSNRTFTPQLTPVVSTYCARVNVTNDPNNEGHIYMKVGTTEEETTELCGLSNGTTVIVRGTRPGYNGFGNHKIVINNADVTWDYTWTRSTTYTVTPSTESDCSIKPDHLYISKTEGSNWTESPLSGFISGATVYVKAVKDGKKPKEWHQNVGANITVKLDSEHSGCDWEDEVETYTVTVNKNGGNCSVKPDSLTISKTPNGTYSSSLEFDDDGTSNIVYIKATKSGKDNITGSVTVNSATVITLGMGTTTCDWDEVVPTTYTVTAQAASCNPSITIVGVSTSENGPFKSSLSVNKGESPTIFAKATRTGYEDKIISQQVSESNPTITIGCSGWQEIEPERHKLTITSTDTPTVYSIEVRENFGTWNTITLTNNEYSGYYEDDTHIEILAKQDGYHTDITTTTSGISDPTEFDMTKDTSINIKWVENTPEYISVERIDISGEPTGNITLDCENPQTYQLTATVYPTTASDKTIRWHSIDESIATVSDTGKVTILSDGQVHIYANGADNVNGHVTLTIVRPAVQSITLNQTSLTLGQDHEEDDVVITGYEPDCAAVTGNYEYYSNDENVAEVTKYGGHVTAKHNGDCTITAYCYTTSGSPVTATCTVRVRDLGPVYVYRTNVTGPDSINSGDCNDSIGASLERKRTDSNTWETVIQDLSNKAGFSWRVENTTQAHVEGQHTLCVDSGVLQDLHIQLYGDYSTTEYSDVTSGHCDIDGIAEGCIINSISLNNSTLNLTAGGSSSTLIATVNASPSCTSSDKTVTWQSSSPSVATVSSNGVVTPIAAGTATITAKVGTNGPTATCEVTVNAAPVTTYNLHVQSQNAPAGSEITITYGGENYNGPADFAIEAGTNVKISAELEGYTPIYSIVPEGVINSATDFNMPERELTIMIGWRKDNVPVESVGVDTEELSIVRGTCQQIPVIVTVYPLDATNKDYTWKSNDETIVTINADGTQLCGLKKGTTTVTVTTTDGNKTADVTIKVIPETYTINVESKQVTTGDTTTLTATFDPSTVNYPLTWTTQDSRITIINTSSDTHTVTVKGNFSGTSWIAATTEDGVRGEGGLTVVDPFSINSIDVLYNDQTLAKPIATRDFSLPTWSTIQMDITTPNPIDVTYSGTATGDILAGPDRIESGTGTYNFDAFCVSNEEPQEAPSVNSASFSFAGETFNVTWDGTYGRIHGNEGNG